jgi:putative transposase
VAIACADVPAQPLPATGPPTGIDRGGEACAPRSGGRQLATPRSPRRRTAIRRLARAHQRVRRARADCPPKPARARGRRDDTIYHAAVQTANLLRKRQLAKASADAGWSAFRSTRSFTAGCAGRRVVAVPPASTSQICSGCGVIVQKGRSVRWHLCPDCGTSRQRDHHAARNIERLGQRLRGAVA